MIPDEHVNKNGLYIMFLTLKAVKILVHLQTFSPIISVILVTFRPIKHFGNWRKWLVRLGCKQDGRASLMGEGCTRNHPFKNQLRRSVQAIKFYLSDSWLSKSSGSSESEAISMFSRLLMVLAFSIWLCLPLTWFSLEISWAFSFIDIFRSIIFLFESHKGSLSSHLLCAVLTRALRLNQIQLSWDWAVKESLLENQGWMSQSLKTCSQDLKNHLVCFILPGINGGSSFLK